MRLNGEWWGLVVVVVGIGNVTGFFFIIADFGPDFRFQLVQLGN